MSFVAYESEPGPLSQQQRRRNAPRLTKEARTIRAQRFVRKNKKWLMDEYLRYVGKRRPKEDTWICKGNTSTWGMTDEQKKEIGEKRVACIHGMRKLKVSSATQGFALKLDYVVLNSSFLDLETAVFSFADPRDCIPLLDTILARYADWNKTYVA